MPKLVNLGSLCIDLVYQVPSLANAGQTIASTRRDLFCGGKGLNQSLAAAKAGADVHHHGAVGEEDGEVLLEALREVGVNTSGVSVLAGPSGHAVIQVDQQGQNSIVISGGTNRLLSSDLVRAATNSLEADDWLLLQNETNDVDVAIEQASARAQVALNLAPPDERARDYPYELLDLLIVNGAEANALAGTSSSGAAFRTLIERYPNMNLVLTLGRDGLLMFDRGSEGTQAASFRQGTFVVEAVDETAAGDAFVGYLMAQLVAGASLAEAVDQASAAGALAVTKAGAAPSIPSSDEVDELRQGQKRSEDLVEIDASELT